MNKVLRHSKLIFLVFLMMAVLIAYQNCSSPTIEPYVQKSYSVSKIGIDFCTTPSDSIQSRLKFIFIQDRSGSNQRRFTTAVPPVMLPGTDPTGERRFPALVSFLNGLDTQPSFNAASTYYSFINFSTEPNVENFGGQTFTNDRQAFINYIDNEGRPPYTDTNNPADDGWTNYRDTLTDLMTLLNNDIAAAERDFNTGVTPTKIASNYVVFFVSDGEPMNLEDGATVPTLQPINQILSLVRRIVDLQNTKSDYVDGISINTAYYSTPPTSTVAEDYLRRMAQEGYGTFMSFLNGEAIDFTAFSIPPRAIRFSLKELWLVNSNAVWEDNFLKVDSDADGLSDDKELVLGSNPNAYDSDGNRLGDGFEYQMDGRPCATVNCPARASACNNVPMGDTDLDDLNNCEEARIGSDRRDPDYNRDYIPDGLAVKWGINVIDPSNATSLDPDSDGVSNYAEVKYNSPIDFRNNQVPNLRLTRYTGRMVSTSVSQDCYHYNVDDMVFLTPTDRFRVYIIENTRATNERRVIRRAEGVSNFGMINLSETDFVRYQP